MNLTHRVIDQNFLVVWLNFNARESINYSRNALIQIEEIVKKTIVYTDADRCVDFLTDIIDERVVLIISTGSDRQFIPLIHDIAQLYLIYVLTDDATEYQFSMNEFRKVKYVSRSIENICQLLRKDVRKCDHDFAPISIISADQSANKDLNELPAPFMYSQILKEVLSEIGDHPNAREDLVHFLHQEYIGNTSQLEEINKFDQTYNSNSAISWYSKVLFIYKIINEGLRTFSVDIIIKMGFLLRDINRQISELYEEQSANRIQQTVYRGQRMENEEFEKLRQSQGGLLSFNKFLSSSFNQTVAEFFLPDPAGDPTITAVLFKIEIDPTKVSAPFAILDARHTIHPDEEEVLFSMHSIFRIGQMVEIKKNVWQVTLVMTSDNDQELLQLTNYIREEIKGGGTGWQRLGHLLIKMGNFDKAEEIYQLLLKQTPPSDFRTRAVHLNQLGFINHHKGNVQEALKLYTERLNIEGQYLHPDHPDLAATYSNIASIKLSIGHYLEALKFYQKTLDIEKRYLHPDSPQLATTYSNIGLVHKSNGKYGEAIQMYQEALKIAEKSLPLIHPDLVPFYNNIATAYYHLGEYPNALQFQQKTLQIETRSLTDNHLHLAMTYCSIGLLHKKMKDYETAMTFYQKARKICELPAYPNHSNLAVIYSNIASLYHSEKKYSHALEFYNQTLEVELKTFGSSHPEVASTYRNIGAIYDSQGEHERALQVYEQARRIYEQHLRPDHPDFATLYNNIGVAYFHSQNYPQALYFFKRALPIYRRNLPPNHCLTADCEENITFMLNPHASCRSITDNMALFV